MTVRRIEGLVTELSLAGDARRILVVFLEDGLLDVRLVLVGGIACELKNQNYVRVASSYVEAGWSVSQHSIGNNKRYIPCVAVVSPAASRLIW